MAPRIVIVSVLACCLLTQVCSASLGNLTVTASTGIYKGELHPTYKNVREFWNIPYALSPTGSRRWMPPVPVSNSTQHVDATSYAPSCPQFVSKVPSVYNQDVTGYIINEPSAQKSSVGHIASLSSEDCLSVAVWTPTSPTVSGPLPVLMFITGGAFITGGIEIPYQLPPSWVSRTQSHIVVTTNYRLNIMGFPNAAGLASNNLGLLDQRAALEWVHANIAAFGGDPTKITLWGQSAGAASVDYQNFAFPDNPIAHGFFMQSGTVLLGLASPDTKHSNFSFVAQHFNCPTQPPAAELSCMRKIPVSAIENFIGQYQDNSTLHAPHQTTLSFTPVPDEQVVFANYTTRYLAGKLANIPAIVSNTAYEGASLVAYPTHNLTAGPSVDVATLLTLYGFICPSTTTSAMRHQAHRTTYRYQYAGVWNNTSPRAWMHAFHASDLPMLFGSYGILDAYETTALEVRTSRAMEDFVLAFAEDPVSGPGRMGWVPFNPGGKGGGTILRFGADGAAVRNVSGNVVDGECLGMGTYNPWP